MVLPSIPAVGICSRMKSEPFPEAYIVRPDFIPEIEREELKSWKELAGLSGPARQWILKYAGSDPRRRGEQKSGVWVEGFQPG